MRIEIRGKTLANVLVLAEGMRLLPSSSNPIVYSWTDAYLFLMK